MRDSQKEIKDLEYEYWDKHPQLFESIERLNRIHKALGDVIFMANDYVHQKARADYYEKAYSQELFQSMKHGEAMMGNLFGAFMAGVIQPLPAEVGEESC